MLQPPRLEDHIKTIGINQSLSNRSSFEHTFLNNIKHIYQHTGKSFVDYVIVSTPKEITDASPSLVMNQTTVKNQVIGNHCVYSQT